jgi:hypothetical protein
VYEGDDALITCVVRSLGSNTVVWKREEEGRARWRLLTAGHERVTLDKRVQVIHDQGKFIKQITSKLDFSKMTMWRGN